MPRERSESEWQRQRRQQTGPDDFDPDQDGGAPATREGDTVTSPLSGIAACDITLDEPEFTPRGTPRVIDATYMRRKVQTIKKRIGEGVALKKKRGELKKEFSVLEKKEAEAEKLAVLAEKLESDPSGLRCPGHPPGP